MSSSSQPDTESSAIAPRLADAIDAYVDPIIADGGFDGAVLVTRRGAIVYERYSGREAGASSAAIGPNTSFLVASITKQFTAAAIERLRANGRLSLDDSLSRFLPEYPHADRITIRHLLTHQSGYVGEPPAVAWAQPPYDRASLAAVLARQPLAFEPGTRTQYGNDSYTVLSFVIEAVSGLTYGAYLERTFFQPLRMTSARDFVDAGQPSHFAAPRTFAINGRRLLEGNSGFKHKGASTVALTARDLSRWARVFGSGEMGELGLANGALARWSIRDFHGRRALQSDGYTPGVSTTVTVFPDDDLVVLMISSLDNREWNAWGDAIAQIALGEHVEPPPRRAPVLSRDPNASTIVGRFVLHSPESALSTEAPMTIVEEQRGLYLHTEGWPIPQYLAPIGVDAYRVRGFYPGEIFVIRDATGGVSALRWMRPAYFAPGMEERLEYIYRPAPVEARPQ
jgi:CubicO group peptidase (beta-lactamase class C family)